MDIRTKLVFALVGVSLLGMLALGTVTYTESRDLLRDSATRQLESLAESRRQDLLNVLSGWNDRVVLIGSRTQLRRSLLAYDETSTEGPRDFIGQILDDARRSVRSVDYLAIYDADGARIVDSGDAQGEPAMLTSDVPREGPPLYLGLAEAEGDTAYVRYLMPLHLEPHGTIGWLAVRLGAVELVDMAADTTGLGASGEILVVGGAAPSRVLHPTRHARPDGPPARRAGSVDPQVFAAAGRDTVVTEGAIDYRGAPVWVATRYIPELDWGVVVKIDASEQTAPILELRERMLRLALTFAAFAILAGILLGLHLARPIHDLAEVADRIRHGETTARARIHHEDEVGKLAETFNLMADTLTEGHLPLSEQETPDA
jgi:HAMP domain-containing protein